MVYAVRKGRIIGIYDTWAECKVQTDKFPGASFKKFETKNEAEDFLIQDDAKKISPTKKCKVDAVTNLIPVGNVESTDIFTDGGQNAQTGKEEAWGCVTNAQGKCIIGSYLNLCADMNIEEKLLPVGKRWCIRAKFENVEQQNNGAELLALITGLRIALTTHTCFRIHTDSNLLLLYWSKGIYNQMYLDPKKMAYILELSDLRKQFEAQGGVIVKISANNNVADLGYHK